MEVKRIELRQLAPYLPYNLKCQLPKHRVRYGQQDILTLNGLSLNSDGSLNPEFLLTNDDLLFGTEIKWWKPVLRPLSDLIKDIEHNSKRFIPIIELAKTIYTGQRGHWEITDYESDKRCCYFNSKGDYDYIDFYLYEGTTPIQFILVPGELCGSNHFDFYQKLFEWHFDIFGLIKNDLAININKL